MMKRWLAPSVAFGLALAVALPAPGAAAQTVVRLCVINNSGVVAQSRMIFRDWRGTEYTTAWVRTALAQQHCETKQDLQGLRFEVRSGIVAAFGSEEILCRQDANPQRSANLTLSGTGFNFACALGQ